MHEWFTIQNQKASYENSAHSVSTLRRLLLRGHGTGKQASLRTKDKTDAARLLNAKNEAAHQPAMNLQIAQVYLHHSDPALTARTWQHVMETMISTRTGSSLFRWQSAIRDKALEPLWQRKLIETTAEHFLAVLKAGTVSTNVYLRRIHNYAVNMR